MRRRVAGRWSRTSSLLHEVMGGTLDVKVDEAKGLLLRAWREE
ncbi:hypothetical protein [Deinococcus psychrotolerans]|nr:hypothetical protein [Deinococcus psychrotolerans]